MKNPDPKSPHLDRALGPFIAMAIVVGTVIGSGIFRKPQVVAQNVPNFGPAALVWVLGGVLAFLGALSLAEVAVLYPRAGGNYVFLREAYGRLAAFLWGWVEFWIIKAASIAALATFFAESFDQLLHNAGLGIASDPETMFWEQRGLTVIVLVVLALVNMRGVRWGGGLQLVITTVKMGSLLAIMALPVVALFITAPDNVAARPDTSRLSPLWPDSWSQFEWGGFGTALVAVLFAYHGWMSMAPMAGEVRNPQRNLPLAFLGGVGIIVFLYLGANLAYYLILPRDQMAEVGSKAVASVFSQRVLGPIGGSFAAAAIMMSTFGALNGNLLVTPRVLYAMGEDRLAPRALGIVHPRFHTPTTAILVLTAWSILLVLTVSILARCGLLTFTVGTRVVDKQPYDVLSDLAMFGAVSFETLAVASIYVFRWRQPAAPRPYRCLGYPVVPALYIVIMMAVLVNMFREQQIESVVGVGFIAVGGLVYGLFLRGTTSDAREPEPETKVPG
jgi:amino acid transporter